MKFSAQLLQFGNNTGIEVPDQVIAALGGGKRPRVDVTLNGFTFSLTLGSMKGKVMIPVSAARRAEAGVEGGAVYEIDIRLSTTPEIIEVPEDLALALNAAGLSTAFDALAPSHRKEHVRAITDAKSAETRSRRIQKALEKLTAG